MYTTNTTLMKDFFLPDTLTFIKPELIYKSSLQFPLMVNIEPTNDCVLRCFMCPRQVMKRNIGYMDFKLYRGIIDESIKYGGILVINFHKDGEPCLHPEFPEMIEYAKKKGKVEITHFNTNAVVLNDKLIKNLIKSGLDDVTFSIDAVNSETFKKIKGEDKLKIVEHNVLRFVELRKKMRSKTPFLRAKIIGCDINRSEIPTFLERWGNLVDEAYTQEINTFGGWIKLKQKGPSFPCQSLWYTLAVNWDGTVNLCSDDYGGYESLGSLQNNTLYEIWTGEKVNQYREFMWKGKRSEIPVCRDCTRWEEGADLSQWLKTRKFVRINNCYCV